jgi:hypothetical protein
MKRLALAVVGVVGVSTLALSMLTAPASATYPDGHFLLAGSAPDHGSCAQVAGDRVWAQDKYTMSITTHDNGDGTFNMGTIYQDASFVTRFTAGEKEGDSPGACQGVDPHGSRLRAGIHGHYQAWLTETITSDTYAPDACPPDSCTTREAFILAVFDCDEYATCGDQSNQAWDYEYRSKDKKLVFKYWQDAYPLLPQEFYGDIATS